MKRKRFLTVVCLVVMLASMTTLCVYAETHTFTNFSLITGQGWQTVPDGNTKDDNEQKAYITVNSKSNGSVVYARVKRVKDGSICTGELAIPTTGARTINYNSNKNVAAGQQMKLQFQATTQNVTASGKWTS